MSAEASTADHWPPLALMVAPNGARRTRHDHPALPMTPAHLADCARDCLAAGAAMLHLHVRDAQGVHSLDVDAYREAMGAIHRAVGDELVLQITTEAMGRYQPPQQMALVQALRPQAVSLAIRELVPDAAHEVAAGAFFGWLLEQPIRPQYILYAVEDIQRLAALCQRGVIPDPQPSVLLVLGRYTTGQRSSPKDLLPMLQALPQHWEWMVCAFGPQENACALTAAALGGHVRVGFENNLHLSDGRLAADNAALVRQVQSGAQLLGRPLMDAQGARTWLGL